MVNRFCISDDRNVGLGCALYLGASIFDHSCAPNACPSFQGRTLTVRTLVDVPNLNLDNVSQYLAV